jgi:hypothetical protein
MTEQRPLIVGLRHAAQDIADGFFEITHNGFALLGLAVAFAALTLLVRPELRQHGENQLVQWLQERQVAEQGYEADTSGHERATAVHLAELPKEQARMARWISTKYRVAPEPIAALVAEAHVVGQRSQLDPALILAIMAIESGFNPFAQSPVGAQGLMQVMTRVHTDKYQSFGGTLAAFDPVSNLRVGVKVLQECIARAGSLEGGLKFYVGAANLPDDGGYTAKVMAEFNRLRQVAQGISIPTQVAELPAVQALAAAPALPATPVGPVAPGSASTALAVQDALPTPALDLRQPVGAPGVLPASLKAAPVPAPGSHVLPVPASSEAG